MTSDINAADNTALRRRMSDVDVKTARGFAQTHTLLEKIYEAVRIHGEGSVSNAAVGAAVSIKKLERRVTSLAEARERSKGFLKSYEDARDACVVKVDRIVRECRVMNKKFFDPHFDMDDDLRSGKKDCLMSLDGSGSTFRPGCVRTVGVCLNILSQLYWILTVPQQVFEDPVMFVPTDRVRHPSTQCADGLFTSSLGSPHFRRWISVLRPRVYCPRGQILVGRAMYRRL